MVQDKYGLVDENMTRWVTGWVDIVFMSDAYRTSKRFRRVLIYDV